VPSSIRALREFSKSDIFTVAGSVFTYSFSQGFFLDPLRQSFPYCKEALETESPSLMEAPLLRLFPFFHLFLAQIIFRPLSSSLSSCA